jgi:vacuolar protein sorting-associated protein 13A/C
MAEDLYFKVHGSSEQVLFAAGSTIPLMRIHKEPGVVTQICIRISNMVSEWSNPFKIDDIGTGFVKIGRIGSTTEDLVRVDIAIEKATFFLSFVREEQRWPIKIENSTSVPVTIRQTQAKKQYLVPSGGAIDYAWDFPSLNPKALVLTVNDKERIVETTQLGRMSPLKYPLRNTNRNGVMALDLIAEGPTIVLKLTPYDAKKSRYKMEDESPNTEFTLVEDELQVQFVVQVRLEGIGISVISRKMEEIAYMTLKSLVVVYTESDKDRKVSASLKWIQIDNQIYGAMEPILLYPTVVPSEDAEDEKPVLLATLSLSKDSSIVF